MCFPQTYVSGLHTNRKIYIFLYRMFSMEKLERISEESEFSNDLRAMKSIAFKFYGTGLSEDTGSPRKYEQKKPADDYACTMSSCHCATY